MRRFRGRHSAITLLILIAACGPSPAATGPAPSVAPLATSAVGAGIAPASAPPTRSPAPAWTQVFADLRDKPASAALATALQGVLEMSADGDGLTATVISPQGTWSGATGLAAGDRAMVPEDQMGIGSITKTLVAAQVMQLVERKELGLEDRAAAHLPADLGFETNGETIANLLSHRSGFLSDTLLGPGDMERVSADPSHVWTTAELLATVGPERGPINEAWEYRGITYVLLGLVVEEVTGRPLAEVLRGGVLAGGEYTRLIYQPDERPTDPMAMPRGAPADIFDVGGGYLPSIANATAFKAEGAMASDALSLARWFRSLCAGEIVSPASFAMMSDFAALPDYGLGIWDRRSEYGAGSGAMGHTGLVREGYRSAALCFGDPGLVVVVLANHEDHDVDTTAGRLWRAASATEVP